jgi:mRNA interferase RelE/StbE
VSQYSIQFLRPARKDLENLSSKMQARIMKAIDNLKDNPHSRLSKKLKGSVDTFRIRVGDYRVIYEIHEDEIVVLIIRVGHRKDVYKT